MGGCPYTRLLAGKHERPELLADPDAYVISHCTPAIR